MSFFRNLPKVFAAAGLLALSNCAPPPAGREKMLVLRFYLQSTEISANHLAQSRAFLRENYRTGRGVLVQGFACDTGGFDISLLIADRRAANAQAALAGLGILPEDIAPAHGIVLFGEPREEHRQVRIHVTEDHLSLAAAHSRANDNALKAVELYYKNTKPGAGPNLRPNSALFWIPLALFVLLSAVLIYALIQMRRRRLRMQHMISEDEAEALEILTGGALADVPGEDGAEINSPDAAGEGLIGAEISQNEKGTKRKKSMAQKKITKITPISIQGAIDKSYHGKTLTELAHSPIDALEGLTPRHARLLEEGFGVKTLEDLAKLRYVEIARAIVVLSRYEK